MTVVVAEPRAPETFYHQVLPQKKSENKQEKTSGTKKSTISPVHELVYETSSIIHLVYKETHFKFRHKK